MSYSFQTFTVGQVLQASAVNQIEINVRDHVHGVAGVVAITGTILTVIDAVGDLIVGTAADTAGRLAAGTAGYVLTAAGASTALSWAVGPLPRSYLAGCGLSNNGVDATNDIDIAAGVARDSTSAVNIVVATMTKQLDANWAAGTNQGMRNSAAAIANGTYHIYAVSKADGTQDIYAYAGVAGTDPDASASIATVIVALQAETGGSAYLYARRIGSILRESAAIVAFFQVGDYVRRAASVQDVAANNPGVSAATRTLSVPVGPKVQAMCVHALRNDAGGGGAYGKLSDLAANDEAPSQTYTDVARAAAASAAVTSSGSELRVMTNTSAQVRSRIDYSDASVTEYIQTIGWIDRRGRDN